MSITNNSEPKEKFSDWLKKKPFLNKLFIATTLYAFLSSLVLVKSILLILIGYDALAQSFFEVGYPVAFVISIYHGFKK